MVNQKYFKTSLSPNKVLIRSFTEIIEFDNVKFHKVYHLKMVFKENFLRLAVNSNFSEDKYFKL